MRSFSYISRCAVFASFLLSHSFAGPNKGELLDETALDFNSDGSVDDIDLLSLTDRVGAWIGQEKYSVIHDLEADGIIDDLDLLFFALGWKRAAVRADPILTTEFLAQTGLSNLSGNTWRFRCMSGGTEDCSGEERTVTGGALTEIGGRTVLPIIWGSATGEPWDILYLTMDGNLAFMGVEKVAEPNGFPGIVVPPQQIGIAGPIPWTTSEVVYPGSILETSGEVTMELGADKTLTIIAAKCLVTTEINNRRVNAERRECIQRIQESCAALINEEARRSCFAGIDEYCDDIEKGEGGGEPAYFYSGSGVLETTGGLRAEADWDLLFVREELVFIQLCWEVLDQRKCLSYGRIFDTTGSPNCSFTAPEEEPCFYEPCFTCNAVLDEECLTGVVGTTELDEGELILLDDADYIRLDLTRVNQQGNVVVTIRHNVPQGSLGVVGLHREQSDCQSSRVQAENISGEGTLTLDPVTIPPDGGIWLEINPEDGVAGAAGGPIFYEVRFEVN